MKTKNSFLRQSHFLGTKIRNLRKRNHLTLEDLSSRCVKLDAESAPSVSYLSMIERGKRVPSEEMLEVIAAVFQKNPQWFLDDAKEQNEIVPEKGSRGGIKGMALEPSFLFSNDILQIAIPEMLAQTGTTGRQFAHLLIRAHQEHNQNHFPDLERAAEEVGKKRMPLAVEDLLDICQDIGLKVKWFKQTPQSIDGEFGHQHNRVVRSYFKAPNTLHLNSILKKDPIRLKYDLAVNIGHMVLHQGDGEKSTLIADSKPSYGIRDETQPGSSAELDSTKILHAWRDFECSFFAGALLCPKVPFRQLLDRNGYDVNVCKLAGVSESIAMRRMTAVSPYPHWHYFDAYHPGTLKAVYRGNGIPLPWGNMKMVEDPCQHWSVFRMANKDKEFNESVAQISILMQNDVPHIYCCESVKVKDFAGNAHVLCSGIDLNPAIDAQGFDSIDIATRLKQACIEEGGTGAIPYDIRQLLMTVARILNISWIERGIENRARLICSRGSVCPRIPTCNSMC
jgi:transcriptional regulator with XRE-family HTH domain/Zn-dependent peptidase ImmA (M78 family)